MNIIEYAAKIKNYEIINFILNKGIESSYIHFISKCEDDNFFSSIIDIIHDKYLMDCLNYSTNNRYINSTKKLLKLICIDDFLSSYFLFVHIK